tara:strand:+ start:1662 stop:2117 length:456 start_codon:yes stop_codon:yes gene_type:complete
MPISSNIIKEVETLISNETSNIANMANVCTHLMERSGWHWVGFYTVDEVADELVLGPFQGPIACTRLKRGKGVCAKSWEENSTVVVENVHEFEGHVACSSISNSEVVIPVRKSRNVVAVLDIDSIEFNGFSSDEIKYLELVVQKLESRWVG